MCVYALDKLPKQSQVFIILFCLSFFAPSIRFLPVSTVVKWVVTLRGNVCQLHQSRPTQRHATPRRFFHVLFFLFVHTLFPLYVYLLIYSYVHCEDIVIIFLAVHHLVGSISLKRKKKTCMITKTVLRLEVIYGFWSISRTLHIRFTEQ